MGVTRATERSGTRASAAIPPVDTGRVVRVPAAPGAVASGARAVPRAAGRSAAPTPSRVDIGAILFPLLLICIVVAPLERGLFFAPDRYPFQELLGVLVLALAVDLLVRGEWPPLTRPLDWAAVLFALGYGAAYLVHPTAPHAALQAVLRAGALLSWYWLAAMIVRGRGRLVWFCRVLFGSGVLLAVLGCLAAAGRFHFPGAVQGQRILSTIQYANAFGALLVTTFIVGVALIEDRWLGAADHAGRSAAAGRRRQPWRPWAAEPVWLGVAGGGLTVVVVTLLGTASRGAWLVFPCAAALWWIGLPPASRWRALFLILWPLGIGLLVSRPVLDAFWAGRGLHGLAVLLAGALMGGAGTGCLHWLGGVWQRQRFTPEVQRIFQGVAVLYGVGVLLFLLLSTGRSVATLAGHGLVAPSVALRAGSIGVQTPDLLQRVVMWRDAWRLIRVQPLLGYGGGGWEALYHSVQSAPYWSSEVHEAILQAWVGGGLPAALGLAVLGAGVLVLGWRARRGATPRAAWLLWGLAVAAFALFVHALADFDLSIPAVAMVLWGAAGVLRSADLPAGQPVPWRWWRGGVGLAAAAGLGLLLILPSVRLERAGLLGGAGAQAMSQHQYSAAYTDYRQALALAPLSGTYLVDQAQLLTLAAGVTGSAALRQRAVASAEGATLFDPGDLSVATEVMRVVAAAGQWPALITQARALLADYPLDEQVYAYAAAALVSAGEGAEAQGDFTTASGAFATVAALPRRLPAVYAARATALSRRFFTVPTLGPHTTLSVGEAQALLGEWSLANRTLLPLVNAGNPSIAGEALTWYSVVLLRAGARAKAFAVFAPLSGQAHWRAVWAHAFEWTGFAQEVS